MTSISLPVPAQPQWMDSPHSRQSSATYFDNVRGHSARRSMARPPNPSFSFPQAPPDDVQDQQQPRQTQRRVPLRLPAFSFPQTSESSSSPPLAETAATAQPRDSVNNSLCPSAAAATPLTTPSSLSTPPPGLVSNPGQGRSRHRHRRSAAISSVDMTAVAKAFPPVPIGGSAPVTPKQQLTVDDTDIPTTRSAPGPQRSPSLRLSPAKPADSPTRNEETPEQLPTRHRPLSTISSEGSVSTLRPTQPTVDNNRLNTASTSSSNQPTSRPKTAGAASALKLTSDTVNKRSEQRRPVSASALVTLNADFSKMYSNREPESSSDTPSSSSTHTLTSDADLEEHTMEESSKGNNSDRKSNKKPKKVRSWAGILTRKTKKRTSKKNPKKAPTPPMLSRTNSEIGSMYGVNFDEDNTIVIRTPTNPDAPRRPLPQPSQNGNPSLSFESSWKPTSFYEQGSELDMASPVIDLDAALGPFNTPEMGSERPSASGFSVATRRMYSGGRRGEFVGPEMRYHRRTESAPEMPPFDRTALAIGRYGLCSAMANPDVFDEEEEDAFLAQNDKPALKGEKSTKSGTNNRVSAEKSSSGSDTASEADTESDAAGLGIQVVDSADLPVLDSSAAPSVESRPSTAQIITPRTPIPNVMEISETHRVPGYRDNVDIVDFDQWSAVHADKQGGLAQPSPRNYHHDAKRPATSPEYVYNPANQPSLSEIPPVPSGFPSPENSRTSFEGPRLMTASSSMTDRYAPNSLYNGEPGSEHYHGSVEDVPSLTSSASTMTGTMPRQSSTSHGITGFADRSASFSTALPRATRSNSAKRSSLVSLSKLVSASTGERSKLSYEEKAPRDEPDKKKKKGYRISRLMHFWKTKEKEIQHSTTQ